MEKKKKNRCLDLVFARPYNNRVYNFLTLSTTCGSLHCNNVPLASSHNDYDDDDNIHTPANNALKLIHS